MGKKFFAVLFAGGVLLAVFLVDYDSVDLKTSVVDVPGVEKEDQFMSPKYTLRPADSEYVNDDGKSYDFGLVKAGAVLEGRGFINLLDSVPAKFSIATVSISNFDGSDDVKNWLRVDGGKSLNVNQDDEWNRIFNFQIVVPKYLLPGEYSIMVQAVLEDFEGLVLSPGASRVKVASGMKVYFSIEGDRIYDMKLGEVKYDPVVLENEGILDVTVNYQNDGNARLYPFMHMEWDAGNGSIVRKDVPLDLCYAGTGCAGRAKEEIDGIKSFGKLGVNLSLSYSRSEKGERFNFGEASFVHYFIPWLYVYAALGLFILLIGLFFWKRGGRLILLFGAVGYTVINGDNLQTVSQKFAIDPDKIIKANKLKSPFFLVPGSKILIPNNK